MISSTRSLCAAAAVCLCVALLAAAPVMAQQRSSAGSTLTYLQRSSIQEQLKLTDSQKEQITKLSDEAKPDFKKYLEELRNLDAAARDAKKKEMNEAIATQREEAGSKALAILDATQRKEFDRLLISELGVSALLQGAIADELKVTDEQKAKIKELLDERNKALRQQGFSASREEREALRREWDGKLLTALTPEQKSLWDAKSQGTGSSAPAAASVAGVTKTPGGEPTGSAAPAAGQPAVASFGGKTSDDAASGRETVKTLSFNFRYAPWPLVLEMFADAAGLTLDMHDTPPGTFNHFDPNEYNVTQALDVLNGYLLREGYLTVQKDGFLIVWKFDNGIPPSLVPEVDASSLSDYGDNQLLSATFKIENGDVEQLARELDVLLDPYPFVRIAALTASNRLVVTDLAVNLRRVKQLIDEATGATVFRQFPIENMAAVEAEALVRSQLGLASSTPNVSSGARSTRSNTRVAEGTNVTADPRTNSLLVNGTPQQIKLVEEILKAIDISELNGRTLASMNANVPYLEVYHITSSNTREVAKTIEALMPGKIVNEDSSARKLHIKATPTEHEEIRNMINKLDSGGQSGAVAVISLSNMDPLVAAQMLTTMFARESDGGPVIQADSFERRLICRGSADQIDQIRTVLLQMGEDGTGAGREKAGKGPIRKFPLGGRDPEEVLQLMERMWKGPRSNPIRIVIPAQESPVRNSTLPSTGESLRDVIGPTGQVAPAANRRTTEARQPASYAFTALMQETEPQEKPAEPAKDNGQSDLLKQFDKIFQGDPPADSRPADEPNGDPEKPEVIVTVVGDTLVVTSQDDDALRRAEEMIDLLNQTVPARTSWTVFYLTSADCTEAATMLEQLFPTSSVSTIADSSGMLGGLSSGLSSFGSSLMDMTGLNSVGAGPQTLRIIPEARSNSLFVSGPEYLVREVEQMLRVLDMADLPQSYRDLVPRPAINVQYSNVNDVADMVKELFKPYTEVQKQQRQQNPFAMMMGGGGSGGNQAGQQVRLTVAVDNQTSQLLVACSEGLYRQIKELVEDLDQAARDANRGVRVVTLKNASAAAVQQTLQSMLPRVRVSSSSTNGSSSGSSGSSSGSSSSNDDAAKAMQEAAARRAAFFGGGGRTSGGGSSSGRTSPFGGRGSTRGSTRGGSSGSPFGGFRGRGGR